MKCSGCKRVISKSKKVQEYAYVIHSVSGTDYYHSQCASYAITTPCRNCKEYSNERFAISRYVINSQKKRVRVHQYECTDCTAQLLATKFGGIKSNRKVAHPEARLPRLQRYEVSIRAVGRKTASIAFPWEGRQPNHLYARVHEAVRRAALDDHDIVLWD